MVKAKHPKPLKAKAVKQEELITYDDYIKEREHLSKYEQTNYDNYEKTIITLAAAFLAFSVSFLGLVRKAVPTGQPPPSLSSINILIWSWVLFAVSILSILFCFPVNGSSLRAEVKELENMRDGKHTPDRINTWVMAGYILYAISGLSFVAGLALLLIFCARNIHIF
jgi:hypothetical protein